MTRAAPRLIVRADLLAGLPYATILPLTTELRPDIDFRITVEPTEAERAARNLASHGRLAANCARQRLWGR